MKPFEFFIQPGFDYTVDGDYTVTVHPAGVGPRPRPGMEHEPIRHVWLRKGTASWSRTWEDEEGWSRLCGGVEAGVSATRPAWVVQETQDGSGCDGYLGHHTRSTSQGGPAEGWMSPMEVTRQWTHDAQARAAGY